ncbi:hypothetical protein GGS20DRAFT_593980 [Poronia punctata]|nr:hypothetical protein GGS20DRAFT_593980 [Poronia punctata]
MQLEGLPEIGGTSFNQKSAVVWLEEQPQNKQPLLVKHVFKELLSTAAQPKQYSGSACSKLCGFVELCSKSSLPVLKNFAFAQETSVELFNYFIEWNEQDSHRSMRLVLDYLVSAIKWNPDADTAKSIKTSILDETISAITLQASKPSTKSSMIAIDHLIQKNVVFLGDVIEHYQRIRGDDSPSGEPWEAFISRIFAWMEMQNVWTVAGKLMVTILTQPWYEGDPLSRHQPQTWHRFIRSGFKANPETLETIKVYMFMPLFKTDPSATLAYLSQLTSLQKLTTTDSQGWDTDAMLWVALLEAGKKTGVVGEQGDYWGNSMSGPDQLPANILEMLLHHRSHEARASGLSILVASPSTTKPYTRGTLRLLQGSLASFHEDVDPKIRYDMLGHSRNITRRVLNAIQALRKESSFVSKQIMMSGVGHGDMHSPPSLEELAQVANKKNINDKGVVAPLTKLIDHEEFLNWYIYFLKKELAPTASYQRHITSLRAMHYFLKSSLVGSDRSSIQQWPAGLLVDDIWFRSVLDLVMDPYEDVRETAASLLALISPGKPMSGAPEGIRGLHSDPFAEMQEFSQKANKLASVTARADHCDGAARAQELLCRWSSTFEQAAEVLETVLKNLEQKSGAAEMSLATAVLQAPVHGDFASLRYIWSSLSGIRLSEDRLVILDGFQNRAIICCGRIWGAVRHILCDDSPEGHLPEELQQVEGLDTKDLLSYSFRAIHESSNLMRIVAQNARHSRASGFLSPSRQNFEDIGNLTFEELSNLRHRGAFSTVSQTFTACCQLVQSAPAYQDLAPTLLNTWYEGALDCIYTQGSTTRRSAGIPAIIVGILASKADSPSFQDVIMKLREIGQRPAYVSETDGSNLAQVHALNCLKDVFKTSFLSQRAEPYLTDCLQLAAQSLQSEVWAIRNCGLILLRSLIDSLFGTTENKIAMEAGWDGRTVRIAYHKFEALPSLLVNLLELGKKSSGMTMGTQTAEAVFPALDIIRRAGPPEAYRTRLYDIISWYLGSHIWHVREIAARTLCSLLLTPTWLESVGRLITSTGGSSNKLHGALLTVRFLLERLLQVMPEQLSEANVNTLFMLLGDLSTTSDSLHTCTEAQAVYIDIYNFIETALGMPTEWSLVDFGEIRRRQDASRVPFALLNIRTGETVVQQALRRSDAEDGMLMEELKSALTTDINVGCAMLEAISASGLPQTEVARSRLAAAYIHVCFATNVPEPRTMALEGLASLLDALLVGRLQEGGPDAIPPEATLVALWSNLYQKPINTSLSDAIIRVSGPLIAISLVRAQGSVDVNLAKRLTSWGSMMSDAGLADRTFDTRIAAVEAIKSVSRSTELLRVGSESTTGISWMHSAHLPWLFALYDALTDDDVEVREAAAEASSALLGLAFVPVEAATRLSRWLAENFRQDVGFLTQVAGRMVGHEFGSPSFSTLSTEKEEVPAYEALGWVSARSQLDEAMRFDDSLFVVEEHNQYIDEVRDARRWSETFMSLVPGNVNGRPVAMAESLAEWALEGLRTLNELTQTGCDTACDGPLGWTSSPQVFAICARIMICASAIMAVDKLRAQADIAVYKRPQIYTDVEKELRHFREVGRDVDAKIHGLLLKMAI